MRHFTSTTHASNITRFSAVLALALVGLCAAGCDLSELTRGSNVKHQLAVAILPTLDSDLDKPDKDFAEAQDVSPEDLKVIAADYVIGRNDMLTVAIYEAIGANVETVRTVRVSESGMVSLPYLTDSVKAAGLTEAQLQRLIVQKYHDNNIFANAQVSVTVNEARQRTFSVLGAVNRPGQYVMVESNFRILDALVLANDASFAAEYLYVVRRLDAEKSTTQPAEHVPPRSTTDPLAPHSRANMTSPMLAQIGADPLAPSTRGSTPARVPTTGAANLSDSGRYISLDGQPAMIGGNRPNELALAAPASGPRPGKAPEPAATTKPAFSFADTVELETRTIRVPLQLLKTGDLRYNIVIRPNDMIIVPPPVNGQYFMGGHLQRPGAYVLPPASGLTLKQAVVAAGMLDATAIPQCTDIVRRVNRDTEIFVRVDMAKIFSGEQPDIYLKPNDMVMVGTHPAAIYLAAIRNAFRFTYGFGFTYDRNFYTGNNNNLGL